VARAAQFGEAAEVSTEAAENRGRHGRGGVAGKGRVAGEGGWQGRHRDDDLGSRFEKEVEGQAELVLGERVAGEEVGGVEGDGSDHLDAHSLELVSQVGREVG
jgi:hypothetical protein